MNGKNSQGRRLVHIFSTILNFATYVALHERITLRNLYSLLDFVISHVFQDKSFFFSSTNFDSGLNLAISILHEIVNSTLLFAYNVISLMHKAEYAMQKIHRKLILIFASDRFIAILLNQFSRVIYIICLK